MDYRSGNAGRRGLFGINKGCNMIYSEFDGIGITGIAAAVPEGVVKIDSLKNTENPQMIDNFIKKTGISSIHKSDFSQTAADFAYTAALALRDVGKFDPVEIGALIFVTQNPDYRTPSTACALHKRLGLSKSCLAFDVNLGCSGFVYGVSIASSILKTSDANKALLLVGDSLARQRILEFERTSNTSLLFGDASAAILIEKQKEKSIFSALMSDGTGYKALARPYGAWKHPMGPESYPGDDIAVFNFTISEVPVLLKEFMEKTHSNIDDFDSLVLHQANKMIMKQIAKKVKMPMEKVPVSLDRFGNTSGASVPLTIVDRYGNENSGNTLKLLTSGYGVGLSWGVLSFAIKDTDILPLCISNDTYDDGYKDDYVTKPRF